MKILGLGFHNHDASAALLIDGKVIAASAEERFDRNKNSSSFPVNTIDFCMKQGKIDDINDIDCIVYYMDYTIYLEWLLKDLSIKKNLDKYSSNKKQLFNDIEYRIELKDLRLKEIKQKLKYKGVVKAIEHHYTHFASVYYTSMFKESAVLVMDAIGEWDCATLGYAKDNNYEVLKQHKYPNSIGTLYKLFTVFLGFDENDAGKVMGLSSYGDRTIYKEAFDNLINLKENGEFEFKSGYLTHEYPARYWSRRLEDLTDRMLEVFGQPRASNEEITKRHEDIAAALQAKTEEIILHLAEYLYSITPSKNLCIAGGVGLNSVANYRVLKESSFENVYIFPAAGDDGAPIGAALYAHHNIYNNSFLPRDIHFSPYQGIEFSDELIIESLNKYNLNYQYEKNIEKVTAEYIAKDKIIGWFQGRSEIGPRALGNRSILANPANKDMKDILNYKVKHREGFRPFAPVCLEEDVSKFFDIDIASPYMLFIAPVRKDKQDIIPSVTHVDGTARLQTINKNQNLEFYNLIKELGEITGIPIVINTSFNVKGEPIVNSPEDAIKCFLNTGIDILVLNKYIIKKI